MKSRTHTAVKEVSILVSVVREVFLTSYYECLVDKQDAVLLRAKSLFGDRSRLFQPRSNPYQIAYATEQCRIEDLPGELRRADRDLSYLFSCAGPSALYREIEQSRSDEGSIVNFASRTYIQVWMGTFERGLAAYNSAVDRYDELCLHAGASSKYLPIHQGLYGNARPIKFDSASAYGDDGAKHPSRESVTLIDLWSEGCVDFRMFPTSDDINQVHSWVQHCYSICRYT